METKQKAIVLLSGGLDSTTCLAIAKELDREIYALTIYYGQKNIWEQKAAQKIAEHYQTKEHKTLQIDLSTFSGSSLTSDLEVSKNRSLAEIGTGVPMTYVPARNTIFLSYALAWADVISASEIYIGVNAIDYSGYPDCRPEFISAFEAMANQALKMTTADNKRLTICTPLINLSKSEIIKKGLELGVDYSLTSTCYDPNDGISCGECDACILRLQGFKDANSSDPLNYLS